MVTSSTTTGSRTAKKAAGKSSTSAKKTAAKAAAPSRRAQTEQLRQRTCSFAKDVRSFVRKTPRTMANMGDCRSLVKASGAIGSYYISADESPSRQDFLNNISSCRREAKQSGHWLQLLDVNLDERSGTLHGKLKQEATELERIFGAIVGKVLNTSRDTEAKEAA